MVTREWREEWKRGRETNGGEAVEAAEGRRRRCDIKAVIVCSEPEVGPEKYNSVWTCV